MNIHERRIRSFRQRITFVLMAKNSLFALTAFGFALGILVIITRAVFYASASQLLWILLLIPLLIVGAFIYAARMTPSREQARAAIEAHNKCGGLLLAAESSDIGGWLDRLGSLKEPKLAWKSRRMLVTFLLAAVLVAVSFAIPQRFVSVVSARSLDVSEEVTALNEKVAKLEEEKVIPQDEAQKLEDQLKEIQREALGADPFKTWEALDHMEESLNTKLDEEVKNSLAEANNLEGLSELASGLQESSKTLDPKLMTAAMSQLAGLMDKALAESDALKNSLSAETVSQCQSGSLNAEGLSELAKALQGSSSDLSAKLQRLADANLIDPSELGKLGQLSKVDAESLSEFLKKNEGKMSMSEMLAEWQKHQAGT
jgi:hypothetical protein